jgi:hypothetical protein
VPVCLINCRAIAVFVGLAVGGSCLGIAATLQETDGGQPPPQAGSEPTLEQTQEYINDSLNVNGSSFDYGFRSQWDRFGFFDRCMLTIASVQKLPGDSVESTAVIDLGHLANPVRYDSAITIRSFDGGSQFITVTRTWTNATDLNEVIHLNTISIGMNDPSIATRLVNAVSHLEQLCGSKPVYDPFAVK